MLQHSLFADDLSSDIGDLSRLFFGSTHAANKSIIQMLGVGQEDDCCRVLFHKVNEEGQWGFIGKPRNNRQTTTIAQFKAFSEGAKQSDEPASILGGINVYFSVNRFFEWRCNRNLSHLHAHYLDIDTPGHKNISLNESLHLLSDVLTQLKNQKLLAPNAIVYTGSGGWHLYWIYKPVEALYTHKQAWSLSVNKLLKRLKSRKGVFTIDAAASSDPTRVLRLPGTFHFGAKDHCKCIYTAPLYTFKDVLHQVDVELESLYPKPKRKTSIKGKRRAGQVNGRHNIKDWWMRVYLQLLQVANKDGLVDGSSKSVKGNRDLFLFLCYVAMRHIKTEKAAFNHVLKLNNQYELFPGDQLSVLEEYLSTARTKMYRYEASTLFNLFKSNFGVYVEFLDPEKRKWKKHIKLDDQVRKKNQAEGALKTNVARKNKTDHMLDKAVSTIVTEGLKFTLKSISQLSGISYATVKRRKDYIHTRKKAHTLLLYSPPKGD